MRTPRLKAVGASLQTVDVFGGYNHNLRIGDGEFYDMKNMTSDFYPVLSPRLERGELANSGTKLLAMITNHGLCYLDGADFVAPSGKRIENFVNAIPEGHPGSALPKKMLSMGGYVIILPDKKWVNVSKMIEMSVVGPGSDPIEESDYCGEIEVSNHLGPTTAQFSPCKSDGSSYAQIQAQEEAPANPSNGDLWIDTSVDPHVLRQWSQSSESWTIGTTCYIKITADSIGENLKKGDSIRFEIRGLYEDITKLKRLGTMENEGGQLIGSAVIQDAGDDFILIPGILEEPVSGSFAMSVLRNLPEMDIVIECGNRLWGCRYGGSAGDPMAGGKELVNEIYASKLGDFKNWYCFQGVSTDSYTASIGADGPFTGAISFQGRPIFFKENCMIEIFGSYPANYQVQVTPCAGVQQGCEKSLAIVNNVLFYKSREGICAFDGSLPVQIGKAFGDKRYEKAVAGGCGSKYYICMRDADAQENTGWNLFVYDTDKGIWHREDDLQAEQMCACENDLYCILAGRDRILSLRGAGTVDTEPVDWMVETGRIGLSLPEMKYVSRLVMRLSMELGAQVSVYAHYDSSDYWEHLHTLTGTDLRSFSIPIRPKRCDHMQLRLEGRGNVKIYSITKAIEQGGDIT